MPLLRWPIVIKQLVDALGMSSTEIDLGTLVSVIITVPPLFLPLVQGVSESSSQTLTITALQAQDLKLLRNLVRSGNTVPGKKLVTKVHF